MAAIKERQALTIHRLDLDERQSEELREIATRFDASYETQLEVMREKIEAHLNERIDDEVEYWLCEWCSLERWLGLK